ncbi:hypothetical protein CR983_01815 [Candidatus Saccharibacteria bacterium]|nr:MAG: hypothetical protein CR983_01815 [Candidatus Saccharibacteria bacterium]
MVFSRRVRASAPKKTTTGGPFEDVTAAEPPAGWENFQPLDVTAGGYFILRNDTDYKVVNQTANGNVRLRGGHRVVVRGLTVNINRPDTWNKESESLTTGLELQENPYPADNPLSGGSPQPDRQFYCEGILLEGPHLTQGVRVACPTADVHLVNVHVAGIRFRDSDHRDGTRGNRINHPDLIQTYGGAKTLSLDGFTGYSSYQGLFFKEDNTIVGGPINLRRVDVHGTEVFDDEGNAYAGHRMIWNFRGQPVTAVNDSVWIDGHVRNGWQPRPNGSTSFYRIRYWDGNQYHYDPAPSLATDEMAIRPTPTSVQTDALGRYAVVPTVTGVLRLGSPPGGEFVPGALVGNGYER